MTIYLDANAIIYAIEGQSPFREAVVARLAKFPQATLVTSRLARLECRVKPLRESNTALLETYESFFARSSLRLAEIDAATIERATDLRARYGLRTPDAIHVATAIQTKADALLTGDASLAKCDEIKVEII